MADNREETLADFQACTGIEDVGECILHLEEADWNLLEAINRVTPQETQTLPSEQRMEEDVPLIAATSSSAVADAVPSTSQSGMRLLSFAVRYKDRTVPLSIPDSETVGTIKSALYSELAIAPCNQDLKGWRTNVNDDIVLSALNLPRENDLQLSVSDRTGPADCKRNGDEEDQRLTQMFKLNVTNETSHKQISINYLGNKTIQDVKQDVFSFTDIPVRHQVWTGWPPKATDAMTLAQSGVNYPCHNLTVKKAATENSVKKPVIDLVSDSSGEEFEDASESFNLEDEIFVHEVTSQRIHCLMPTNIQDETEALVHFTTEFSRRYGECHPMFFQGSLDDALKEACMKPARERRLLAIFLHHDNSVLANVFCTQLLCSETVVSYLSNNFITWAWDVTNDANRARLLAMVTKHFGSMAASTIKNFSVEQLPLMLIIMRSRATTEVFTIIHGSVGLEELMTSLIHAVDVFSSQQHNDIREEDEREARETVKREQDQAYEVSLQADRIKEEAKRLQVEEHERQTRAIQVEKEKEQRMQQEQAAVKEAQRQSLAERLPPEPPSAYAGAMCHARFRMPDGAIISRRFRAQEPLQVLLDFLVVKGYHTNDFKVLSSWPRRDLTALNPQSSLAELQLCPQETITLEER